MWQTKYALAVPKKLGVGVNFRPCSEGYFLFGRPYDVGNAPIKRISPQCDDNLCRVCLCGEQGEKLIAHFLNW